MSCTDEVFGKSNRAYGNTNWKFNADGLMTAWPPKSLRMCSVELTMPRCPHGSVDDMLRLARLSHHPGQSCELADLTALVADCAARVRITDSGRRWRVDIADGLQMVGDWELLRRAVDNLCANVLVHTPPGTVGTVTAAANAGWLDPHRG